MQPHAEFARAAAMTARLFPFLPPRTTEESALGTRLNAAELIERTAQVFANGGWEVPRMVEAMRRADDLYFDTVSQIRMPRWDYDASSGVKQKHSREANAKAKRRVR